MLAPNRVNGRIDPVVPQSCRVGAEWRTKRMLVGGNIPKTPAELPKNVPLRVTELRMLLIRSRIFDIASGLLAPSRKPHAPPRARPIEAGHVVNTKTIRWHDKVKFGQVRFDAKRIAEGGTDREKYR